MSVPDEYAEIPELDTGPRVRPLTGFDVVTQVESGQ
jgi:hypothetical protein